MALLRCRVASTSSTRPRESLRVSRGPCRDGVVPTQAEALYIAERSARDEVRARAEVRQANALRDKEAQEARLRDLAAHLEMMARPPSSTGMISCWRRRTRVDASGNRFV